MLLAKWTTKNLHQTNLEMFLNNSETKLNTQSTTHKFQSRMQLLLSRRNLWTQLKATCKENKWSDKTSWTPWETAQSTSDATQPATMYAQDMYRPNTSQDVSVPHTATPASKMWSQSLQETVLWTPTKLLRLNTEMLINFHIKIIKIFHNL
jgi:hypothetical protein